MRQPGIEPGAQRWQRWILPLNHWHILVGPVGASKFGTQLLVCAVGTGGGCFTVVHNRERERERSVTRPLAGPLRVVRPTHLRNREPRDASAG